LKYLAAPMAVAGVGIFLSIIGIYLVRTREGATMHDLLGALSRSVYLSSAAIALLVLGVLYMLELPGLWRIWVAIVTGLTSGILIGRATEYYTSHEYKPTQGLALKAQTGAATTIIDGIAVGMMSTGYPVITIVVAIAVSYFVTGGVANPLMGLYGIGIAAVGMLSTLGLTLATDAYGPIADNAGGNAQMAGLEPEVRKRTDQLDSLGNTTAATGKGFAIGSAALTAMALLAAYIEQIRYGLSHLAGVGTLSIPVFGGETRSVLTEHATLTDFTEYYSVTLMNPSVLMGLFIGSVVSFFFCALTMKAVGLAASQMVDEARRQFAEKPGIMNGTEKPDYARCVEISTVGAQRQMIFPSVVAVLVPMVVGMLFSVAGVLGLLAGALTTGFVLAVMMANAGGAWDNAKKYIEEGHYGGPGSEAHKAAVVGDTVGDPFKDTSGPSLNILIKLMAMVSIVSAGVIAKYAGVGGLLTMWLG
ncbi:MAG: sodium-translocating pyrophosphatase, partial [Candidatus Poribacteria bacterium]|nr:sodium-translocating pyrophosphatase [Candidatus Poribacteria bacterium]